MMHLFNSTLLSDEALITMNDGSTKVLSADLSHESVYSVISIKAVKQDTWEHKYLKEKNPKALLFRKDWLSWLRATYRLFFITKDTRVHIVQMLNEENHEFINSTLLTKCFQVLADCVCSLLFNKVTTINFDGIVVNVPNIDGI